MDSTTWLEALIHARGITAGALVLLSLGTLTAHADGAIPALSYRYLQPPPAFQKGNLPPGAGLRTLPRDYLTTLGWGVFTTDAQAGVTGRPGTFHLRRTSSGMTILLQPVPAPTGLPIQVALDGNAYRVSAHEQPSGATPTLTRPLQLVLRWPHIPVGLYGYQHKRWREICTQTSATVTSTTIACRIHALGIYAAVTIPSNATVNYPVTPVSQLNPYIPVLVAALLLIAVVIIGYLVSRPDERRTPTAKKR